MRIGIVGYGTAGQAAAIFLARAGHAVEVFEQSPQLRPVGAGFLLQPTGLGVLAALGLDGGAFACGARIERLHGETTSGRTVMDMRYADHAPDCFGLGMTRGALFELLHRCAGSLASVRTGARIVAVDARAGTLDEASGVRHGPYDLVVVADGAHSALRAQGGIAQRDPVYPWGAVWCLLPADDWPHAAELRQRYDGTRTMIGALPVGLRPDDAQRRWLTYFFSLPGEQVESFDAPALARMHAEVARVWPELVPLVRAIDEPAKLNRARYRDVVLRCPWRGRAVCIGDAAHAMSPQLGQGVNMALLDALALADALAHHPRLDEALAHYARSRAGHLAVYQRLSRWLTPLFQSDHVVLGKLRDIAFGPSGRLPFARGQMLKILTGTKRGWLR